MKYFYLLLIFFFGQISPLQAQGWPDTYDGVMLQGFYWDSYAETSWSALKRQADELSPYFDLIWVPNSAYAGSMQMNMGYHPIYWYKHDSAFGTSQELQDMIRTFKERGMGVIEDVVINHRNGVSGWLDFAQEEVDGTMHTITAHEICADDEAAQKGYAVGPNADTGEHWDGARDLDHSSPIVWREVISYLKYLKQKLGYVGYRYDFVKGYAPQYIARYNRESKPRFSVGEYWDGNAERLKAWIDGTTADGVVGSAAFDFATKYLINDAFGHDDWRRLEGGGLVSDPRYARYAVTFIDNHDTYRDANALRAGIAAANAYMLCMPGTPCVFYKHWVQYKTLIKRMIVLRKLAGLHNSSRILQAAAQDGGFRLMTQGQKSKVLLLLGKHGETPQAGFKPAVSGDGFCVYLQNDIDTKPIIDIKDETSDFVVPNFCVINAGETCAFFEAPSTWQSDVYCWMWDRTHNYTGNHWPGVRCTRVGVNSQGRTVWKWVLNEAEKIAVSSPNKGIIFSNQGQPQTHDMEFVSGGYYTEDGLRVRLTQGIDMPHASSVKSPVIYDLRGQRISRHPSSARDQLSLPRGVYIMDGKKIVVR